MNVQRNISAMVLAAAALAAVLVVGACGDDDDSNQEAATEVAMEAGRMDHEMMASDGTAEAEFHDAMRKLWEDHITWTRLAIISIVDDLPDAEATVDRLLKNQDDLGDAIKPYYGEEAGAALTGLLREHILGAADLLTAAKAGDQAAISAASESWYANGASIAAFLADANPENWPLAEMEMMMRGHLDLTLEEATARLTGDHAAEVVAYDKVHEQILEMADMLSDGIVAQFPDQF